MIAYICDAPALLPYSVPLVWFMRAPRLFIIGNALFALDTLFTSSRAKKAPVTLYGSRLRRGRLLAPCTGIFTAFQVLAFSHYLRADLGEQRCNALLDAQTACGRNTRTAWFMRSMGSGGGTLPLHLPSTCNALARLPHLHRALLPSSACRCGLRQHRSRGHGRQQSNAAARIAAYCIFAARGIPYFSRSGWMARLVACASKEKKKCAAPYSIEQQRPQQRCWFANTSLRRAGSTACTTPTTYLPTLLQHFRRGDRRRATITPPFYAAFKA